MRQTEVSKTSWPVAGRIFLAAAAMLMATGLTGCLVAGYSSGGGFFVWPGSIVLTVLALLLFFFLRRGR